ncbi:hypothetical protein CsSME_00048842 [Camellia sinensis var. sinensis]
MALTPVFELVRASLLHRDPLPTLEQAVTELLFEETPLAILKPTTDTILVVPHPQTPSSSFTQIWGHYKQGSRYKPASRSTATAAAAAKDSTPPINPSAQFSE